MKANKENKESFISYVDSLEIEEYEKDSLKDEISIKY